MRRFVLIAALIAGLAPGTWLRTRPAPPDFSAGLQIQAIAARDAGLGDMTLEGAWELTSNNAHFGSYSALLVLPDRTLLAASDRGRFLRSAMPGLSGKAEFGWISGDAGTAKKLIDIEAMARDPASGRIWLAYEGTNTIERRNAGLGNAKTVQPAALAGMSNNSGPEAFTRLADGRFVVLAEGARRWFGSHHRGYLFDRDPVTSEAGTAFAFVPPAGYRPVDMAQIPDGRVLVLVRRVAWGVPPRFPVKLVLADPAQIAPGKDWAGTVIASLSDPSLSDNYEGLAVVPQADSALDLWLISDDNNAVLQRTLLLKLRWDPHKSGQAP